MIPAAFEYVRAHNLSEAVSLLAHHGDNAKLLAGGHSLLPMMKMRLAQPATLIDIGCVAELRGIRDDIGSIMIGALTTHDELTANAAVLSQAPLLAETASRVGDIQVRNVGTIGGSLAHADPAADYPAAVLALEATVHLRSAGGERAVAARDFFVDLMTTAARPDEILTHLRVPRRPPGQGWCYMKLPHPASGYAMVGLAALVTIEGGKCADARLAITGAGPKAVRLTKVEAALEGKALDDATIASAAQQAADGIDATDELYASATYKNHIAKVYAKRALAKAVERAR
ncbi:MAG: xanthine dehydrogenase family protein subunit M [Armatimonadetes bacterium]|nr:xanthine dehydrogenase family protein subunit M [Armatimonadota bacterium]